MSTTRFTTRPDHPDTTTCPDCGGSLEQTPTETSCADCGLVTESAPIDRGPDWNNTPVHEPNGQHAEVANPDHDDAGLGSMMGHRSERDTSRLRRLATWDHRTSRDKRGRSRGYVSHHIRRVAGHAHLPRHVADRACRLFRDLRTGRDLFGHDYDELIPALVLLAAREQEAGRTAADIEPYTHNHVESGVILKRMRWCVQQLGIALPIPKTKPRARVVAGRLDGGGRVLSQVEAMIEECDVSTRGVEPSSVVGAAFWVAGRWSQKTVAEAVNVTPKTIREHSKRFGD